MSPDPPLEHPKEVDLAEINCIIISCCPKCFERSFTKKEELICGPFRELFEELASDRGVRIRRRRRRKKKLSSISREPAEKKKKKPDDIVLVHVLFTGLCFPPAGYFFLV